MDVLALMVVFALIIGLGFYAMSKIDRFRRERSRQKGLPMDEED